MHGNIQEHGTTSHTTHLHQLKHRIQHARKENLCHHTPGVISQGHRTPTLTQLHQQSADDNHHHTCHYQSTRSQQKSPPAHIVPFAGTKGSININEEKGKQGSKHYLKNRISPGNKVLRNHFGIFHSYSGLLLRGAKIREKTKAFNSPQKNKIHPRQKTTHP